MKVVWSERALARLQQLHDYIARDQPINARRVIQRLLDREEQFGWASAQWSYRCGVRRHRGARADRCAVPDCLSHRIGSDRVTVLSIRHGAEILPERWSEL